jgi:hypothetical protein
MSQISLSGEPPLLGSAIEGESTHRICQIPEKGWDRLWLWATERINPIVVKEVRQSLKSRQFTIAFGLTLIAAISWTLIAISLMVPRIYYTPAGVQLLTGFFCILQFPLMIIIPFSAFRSLTTETEDSTFELLSISALSAWQIVMGKMMSALLQALLYLSALAPCIVLTYLLRGVSLDSILFVLGLTVTFSVIETALALLLAAVSRARILQAGATVLLLIGLIIGFFSWTTMIVNGALVGLSNMPKEFYIGVFGFATVLLVALDLVLRSAAAAIDFPSENHSTPLRKRVLLLVGLILFWSTFAVVASREEEFAFVFLVCAFIVCMFIGSLMTGELGIISPRARRSLPKTFAGRVFLTWFYPGAGMGYIFLVCLFAALVATMCITELYYSLSMQLSMGRTSIQTVGYLLMCYLTIYLGINRLAMLAVAKHMPARMLGSFALMAVLLLTLQLGPLMLAFALNDYREFEYEWHQALNIIWTCNRSMDGLSFPVEVSMGILTLASIAIFGLNLVLSTRDVMLVRIAEPPRVRAENQVEAVVQAPNPFAD